MSIFFSLILIHFLFPAPNEIVGRARKGFLVAVLFPLFNMMSASYVILTYGPNILKQAHSHFAPEISLIANAGVQILGTAVSSQLVDRKGRKFLLIVSLVGCALGHATFYAFLAVVNAGVDVSAVDWLPIVCMSFIVFFAGIGIIPLTLICTLEYFDSKLRSVGLTFGNIANNVLTFIIVKAYPSTEAAIGLPNCIIIFCVSCLIGIGYIIFYVEETNGKELNVVDTSDE